MNVEISSIHFWEYLFLIFGVFAVHFQKGVTRHYTKMPQKCTKNFFPRGWEGRRRGSRRWGSPRWRRSSTTHLCRCTRRRPLMRSCGREHSSRSSSFVISKIMWSLFRIHRVSFVMCVILKRKKDKTVATTHHIWSSIYFIPSLWLWH